MNTENTPRNNNEGEMMMMMANAAAAKKRVVAPQQLPPNKRYKWEGHNNSGSASSGAATRMEEAEQGSLRAMQLIRLQQQQHQRTVSVESEDAAASSTEGNNAADEENHRQRLFAGLIAAAAAVAEPDFRGAAAMNTKMNPPKMTTAPSTTALVSRNHQGGEYGAMMYGAGANPFQQQQQHVTPDVAHYLQVQALKRQLQQQQNMNRNGASQWMMPSTNNMAGFAMGPRPSPNMGGGWYAPNQGHASSMMMSAKYGATNLHGMFPSVGYNNMGRHNMSRGVVQQQHNSHCIPVRLPVLMACPEDAQKVSSHQVLLRHQIEAFQATEDDVTTHTRGRNKPIKLGQVGIRCKHCAHLPVLRRQKGSTYFPATTLGLYQAAQNMSTTHIQCGLCNEMPSHIKEQFAQLLAHKASSAGAGRPYWAETARNMGLVDTQDGIYFIRELPVGAILLEDDSAAVANTKSSAKKATAA